MTFQERLLLDQGHFLHKTAGGNSYIHQNGKEEGEAVGNLDRRLEWKTIHVGTDTTEQVQGVP